jgi:DNA-binding FadR family transcriptional regulator
MASPVAANTVLQYIIEEAARWSDEAEEMKLPPMDELASKMGVSRGKAREELLAAQAYGVIEMRPGDGTYVRPFDFHRPVQALVLYAVARDRSNFDRLYQLRTELETAFWERAVTRLTEQDLADLRTILARAEQRLEGRPAEIPHAEHRDFHMMLFSRLDNGFVLGLLAAYWDAYEAVGLHRYFEYGYYEKMWSSHQAMVDAVAAGRLDEGREVLAGHFTLLQDRLQEERGDV